MLGLTSNRLPVLTVLVCVVSTFDCSGGVDRLIVDAEDASVEISYEAEKVYEDRAQFCDKVKKKAQEIILEASDGYDEITLSSPDITPEVQVSIKYIIAQATGIIDNADLCVEKNNETDERVTEQIGIVDSELESVGSINTSDKSNMKKDVKDLDCLLGCTSDDFEEFAELFIDNAENIITAGRDMLSMVEDDESSNYEAQKDAKDSKEEIKALCYDIIDYANEMQDSNEEFRENVDEGVEVMEVAADAVKAQN